jgi:hypothetical protein
MIDDTLECRCCTWWNGPSPPSGSSSNSSRYSPRPAVRRRVLHGQRFGVGFASIATVLRWECRVVLHSAWYAVEHGYIESFNNRLRKECLNRNHWNSLFEARVVIGDFKHEHNHRHRHSALGYRTPAEYAAACRHTPTPVACEIN